MRVGEMRRCAAHLSSPRNVRPLTKHVSVTSAVDETHRRRPTSRDRGRTVRPALGSHVRSTYRTCTVHTTMLREARRRVRSLKSNTVDEAVARHAGWMSGEEPVSLCAPRVPFSYFGGHVARGAVCAPSLSLSHFPQLGVGPNASLSSS